MLEDEIESGQTGYDEKNKFWLTANISGWTDIGSVRVLNLVDVIGNPGNPSWSRRRSL